jgi:hypothetical protein
MLCKNPFDINPLSGNDFQREGLVSHLTAMEPQVADNPDGGSSSYIVNFIFQLV